MIIWNFIILFLIMDNKLSWSILVEDKNFTIPTLSIGFPIMDVDNSEMELSAQVQEIDELSNGWSQWSEWSACSRSCDGGATHQLRSCITGQCNGDRIRYKICNMQPCPNSPPDFRVEQCKEFNTILYEGANYEWFPFYDDEEPCALTCRGKLITTAIDGDINEEDEDDGVLIVVKLKDKVHDGTRCRPGSLDMCINGDCKRVGCDLKIGSFQQINDCGICGGDASSCTKPLYHWSLIYSSLCSVTCGGGFKMSRPVCRNRLTGDEVEEELCNDSQRPNPNITECNIHKCPPKWHTYDWGSCSVSCGDGTRTRLVQCEEETNNTRIVVDEMKCSGSDQGNANHSKPLSEERCNQMDCSMWFTNNWSGCSVSCGEGIQTRMVECRDSIDQPSNFCDIKSKPESSKICSTGIACSFDFLTGLYQPQKFIGSYKIPLMPESLIEEHIIPSESTYIPEEWGPCSVTCGEGVRQRDVYCKIYLEFSKTIAKLPDKQCTGTKPIEYEKCYTQPCSEEKISMDVKDDPSRIENIKVGAGSPAKSYSWKEQGFTSCSASCLGGVQELIVNCIRDDTEKITSPFMCPIELKPEVIIRACNEHSCPPRWSFTNFSQCSQSCGIGIQTRDVNCIHELTQGGSNTVVVPNNRCPQPPPPDRQYCNVLDCPVRWKVSEWSRCSSTCGGGEKTRKVDCKQVMAQNHTVDRPPSMCPNPRPVDIKPCNTKSCLIESDKPLIGVTNSTFIQHDSKKKKITVKVGGAATLYTGTTVKIKCPVKRFDKSKIQWKKDGNFLPQTKKFKSSRKGALRVLNLSLSDSGIYTCIAAKSFASITISVRPKPGEFPTSEEIQKHTLMDRVTGSNKANTEGKQFYVDDQSHEQRPIGAKKTPKLFTPTSTSPSLTLDSYIIEYRPNNRNSTNKQKDKITSYFPSSSSTELIPNNPNYEDSRNSASRPMPDILSLIFKIQILGRTTKQKQQQWRNLRIVKYLENIDKVSGVEQTSMIKETSLSSSSLNTNINRIIVLSKKINNNESVTTQQLFTYTKTNGNGTKQKQTSKRMKLYSINSNVCMEANIPLQNFKNIRKSESSPLWFISEWKSCEISKCIELYWGIQKRNVDCKIYEQVTVDPLECDQRTKHIQRPKCFNKKCLEKWTTGENFKDHSMFCKNVKNVKYV